MSHLTRRTFGAGSAAAGSVVFGAGTFKKPIGVQLYTVRELMPKNPKGTLAEISKIGYASVEPGRAQLAQIAPIMKDCKLTAPSVGIETPLVTGNWGAMKPVGVDLAKALDELKAHGARYAGVMYVTPDERKGGLDFYRKFADQMNKAGEQARKAGLQLYYHNHSFEFEPMEGSRPFDVLVERFDKAAVKFEIDIFWVKMGGEDPAGLLRKLKGRVALVHLKDVAAGTQKEYFEGKVPKGAFKEVGKGSLDMAGILKAAEEIGVEQYIVEQDQCPVSPIDSLKMSYSFLRKV